MPGSECGRKQYHWAINLRVPAVADAVEVDVSIGDVRDTRAVRTCKWASEVSQRQNELLEIIADGRKSFGIALANGTPGMRGAHPRSYADESK